MDAVFLLGATGAILAIVGFAVVAIGLFLTEHEGREEE